MAIFDKSPEIAGGTDGTTVGNTGDRLHVDSKLRGHDGVHNADVFLEGGVRKLQTNATATVESLFGEAVNPFTAIKITNIGVNGDTIRTRIPDDSVDVTTTKTASETTLNALAKKHRDELNASSNFNVLYRATVPLDSHEVCIEAKLIQTLRLDSGDVLLTVTGSLTAVLVWDKIDGQSLALALFPHPKDCTKGTISVLGTVGVISSGVPPKRLLLFRPDAGTDEFRSDMGILATSGSPVVFKLTNNPGYDSTKDLVVTELRLECTAQAIQLGSGQYLKIAALPNGHLIQVRSEGTLRYNENIKLAEDFHHAFAIGEGSKFDLITGTGDTSLVCVYARPFRIRKGGSFSLADDCIATIRDDLSSGQITRLRMSVIGFEEE